MLRDLSRNLFTAHEDTDKKNNLISSIVQSIIRGKQSNSTLVTINKFKKIDSVTVELKPLNIFIGTNNSGKSSFIQGIQFAISSCQTLELKKVNWVRKGDSRTLALDSSDFLYTPTRQIENLYHGHKLSGAKTRDSRKSISFAFAINGETTRLFISRGKNGGFTTHHQGKTLGQIINSIDKPFCVYVPGIAGIPIEEKYEVPIAIKKSATRGDSNNYLRNILFEISKERDKWERFHQSINRIYPDTEVKVHFDQHASEFISVNVISNGLNLPIDSVGTGVLQSIQIFAYLEYFSPQILLLDEPDSHIHPTKQKLLAKELYDRTITDPNLKIVFSTHSRYILEALEDYAQVIHFQNGIAYPDVKGSKILLDIGAADTDYLFSKKELKYIIVTEDKVDNIEEKKQLLKKIVFSTGLTEDQFVLHSYEGCTKIHFAKLLQGFVQKHIPEVKVIVHVDRDQRTDDDHEIQKISADCEREEIQLFLTEMSELENYFCMPDHIQSIYNKEIDECRRIYDQAITELKEATIDKTRNFIIRNRPELMKNKDGKLDVTVLDQKAQNIYNANFKIITPGKELLGRLKKQIQEEWRLDPNHIMNFSQKLQSKKLKEIIDYFER